MLPDTELAAMQTAVLGAMPETVVVKRPVWVSDNLGGSSLSLDTIETTCGRLDIVRRGVGVVGGELTDLAETMITLPGETDVQAGDLLSMGDEFYQVKSLSTGTWSVLIVAMVKDIGPDTTGTGTLTGLLAAITRP